MSYSIPAVMASDAPGGELRSSCDIIGDAFRLWRHNWKLILKVTLSPTLVMLAGGLVMQVCMYYASTTATAAGTATGAAVLSGMLVPFMLITAGGMFSFVVLGGFLWNFVRLCGLTRYFMGFSETLEEALKIQSKPSAFGWLSVLGVVVWFALLVVMFAWFITMFLGGVLTGVASGAGGPVLGVILGIVLIGGALLFGLAAMGGVFLFGWLGTAVMACEGGTAFGALGRAVGIFRSGWSRTFMFGLILLVVMYVAHVSFSVPAIAVSIADLFGRGLTLKETANAQPSLPVLIFNQVWEILVNMMLRPVTLFACAYMYLDYRQRVDGIDLSRKLHVLKAKLTDGTELQ